MLVETVLLVVPLNDHKITHFKRWLKASLLPTTERYEKNGALRAPYNTLFKKNRALYLYIYLYWQQLRKDWLISRSSTHIHTRFPLLSSGVARWIEPLLLSSCQFRRWWYCSWVKKLLASASLFWLTGLSEFDSNIFRPKTTRTRSELQRTETPYLPSILSPRPTSSAETSDKTLIRGSGLQSSIRKTILVWLLNKTINPLPKKTVGWFALMFYLCSLSIDSSCRSLMPQA